MIALATVDIATAETDHLVASFVTDGDRHASARHKLRQRQRQGLAARALVRSLLTKYFDHAADCWHLTYDANGKPAAVLADNSRHIALSISHSKDLVACAMTNLGPIGIDVEYCEPRRMFADIAASSFGEAECRVIANGGATTFYKIWTLREAFAKATGLGFMQLVDGRDYFSDTPDTQVWCGPEQHQDWVFGYQLASATYAAAFAMKICNSRLRAVDDTVPRSTSCIVNAARTAWLSISQCCR
jgi:4'-phosphopantetheinyl transferase